MIWLYIGEAVGLSAIICWAFDLFSIFGVKALLGVIAIMAAISIATDKNVI